MDLKFALRSLGKNPGFTILAVLVMALGIGANTAMFSVIHAVLLRPLAYRNPDRIVTLSTYWKKAAAPISPNVSAPDYHDWHDQSTAFEAMAFYQNRQASVLLESSTAEYVDVAPVTFEFFRVFAVEPEGGRLFTAAEHQPGAAGAAVISHAFWQSHYGGNLRAIGSKMQVFGKTLTIVGILPPQFRFPRKTDIWFPFRAAFEEVNSRGGHNYFVTARLKPGVSLEQAQSQMTSIASRLERQYPQTNGDKSAIVLRMRDDMVRDVRLTLYMLFGAVGVVLLIACANVATLLLVKATARSREIAIRAAVGASRGRIVRQLIVESLVLALLAAGAGLILAVWGSDALVRLAPGNVPRLAESGIDAWVLAFTLGVSVLASLVFGLAPAIQASRTDLNEALKQGAARSVVGGTARRMRGALVVAEIALSVVLLAAAGLLIKSFVALHNVALGFQPEHVLVMQTTMQVPSNKEGDRAANHFFQGLLSEVGRMPGVSATGATMSTPGHVDSTSGYSIDHPVAFGVNSPEAVMVVSAPGLFGALGIPIVQGRDFDGRDAADAPMTAIINQALARKEFAGRDPIGHLILAGYDTDKPMKIVGVAGDVRQGGPAHEPLPQVYMPYQQHHYSGSTLNVLVRTTMQPASLQQALQQKVHQLSPDASVKFTTMEASLAENVAAPRFRTLLLSIFAALAVSLAMAGVYSVMAYVVGQRASEIGLRMALGASPRDVLRLVLGQGLRLAWIGLALGLAGAAALTRLLTGLLFEVKPADPPTYVAVSLLLAVVVLAASYIPARRAAKVDPLVALRQE